MSHRRQGVWGGLANGEQAHFARGDDIDLSFMEGGKPPLIYLTECELCGKDLAIYARAQDGGGMFAALCAECFRDDAGYAQRYKGAPPVNLRAHGRETHIGTTRGHYTPQREAVLDRLLTLAEAGGTGR